ncbi:MAG: ArsR/SmtB family transcription factor [Aestuariivirga sp.]|jgi:DNA-binding transcriptional ArsR family regulator
MKESQAISIFAALAQETRIQIVRRLVKAGDTGMPSGALAEALGVSAASMSFHLGQLESAGLVTSSRQSRSIIYKADYRKLGAVIRFLMEDCCNDDPRVRACC